MYPATAFRFMTTSAFLTHTKARLGTALPDDEMDRTASPKLKLITTWNQSLAAFCHANQLLGLHGPHPHQSILSYNHLSILAIEHIINLQWYLHLGYQNL
ncbi:hypothetical protein O6H91_Y045500 [Diphasiastrum complanatum]|nr:hypothetical protein O6H91_Y045500 [Diphasiastrum complanatum]